jgi:hypothetical protein
MISWAGSAALVTLFAACQGPAVASLQSAVESRDGEALDGETLQGTSLVGSWPGDDTWRVWLDGIALEQGKLVGWSPPRAPTDMVGVHLAGTVCNNASGACLQVLLAISDIVGPDRYPYNDPWVPKLDPASTLLYKITVETSDGKTFPLCNPDIYGSPYAIAVDGTWDAIGNHSSTGGSTITLGCLSGVVAKCYKWGYQPWQPSTGVLSAADVHQACTRAARADYCGDGVSHTAQNTPINIYDFSWFYPSYKVVPKPVRPHHHIQGYLPNDPTFHDDIFEAGFGTSGALCLSHWRYNSLGVTPEELCPHPSVLFGPDPKKPRVTLCDTYPIAYSEGQQAGYTVPIGVDSEMYDLP